MNKTALFKVISLIALISTGCGGGGGGSSGSTDNSLDNRILRVQANVASDTCGERISNVDQQMVVYTSGSNITVNTSLISLAMGQTGSGYSGGFSETNGDCTRDYTLEFDDVYAAIPNVTMTSKSTCGSSACESTWVGTATEESTLRSANMYTSELIDIERINGERCNAAVPNEVGYRPSLFECNGNSAVLLSGNQRNNYSVVVRRNGQFNDRDPNNPSCGTNRCSPYKTQKKIELAEYQVNCLGDSGFSDLFAPVNRISIKYTALVRNPSDTSQFEQYCLVNTQGNLN